MTATNNIVKCIVSTPNPNNPCNVIFDWSHFSLGTLTDRLWDMKLVPEGAPTHVIFTGEKVLASSPIDPDPNILNSTNIKINEGHSYEDFDVVVGRVPLSSFDPNDPNGGGYIKYFNSAPGFNSGNANPSLFSQYPIDCTTQFGPATPGYSVSGHPNCGGSPAVDYYLSQNSRDAGRSIVQVGNYIYVAAELRITIMTSGKYTGFHYTESGVAGAGVNFEICNPPGIHYDDYRDAYIYLLKIDATTGNLSLAKNVAHFSGGDFGPSIILDQDGNLVLAGNTADKNICGLPDAPGAEANMLIKINPNDLSTIWQEHFLVDQGNSDVKGTCAFGLIQTADGGYVIVGNQADALENETFSITRFTPDCNISYDLKGDYSLTNSEVWNAATKGNPYRVNGNIIIPAGKTLTIDGITVEFANTRFNPFNAKCGITVQKQGRLILDHGAILTAASCGIGQMWDGITVEGDPEAPGTASQGKIYMLNGYPTIEHAQRGVVLGNAAWDFETKTVSNAITGATGTNQTAKYNDNLGKGGGIIFANSGRFLNCGKGVVWNPKKYSVSSNRLSNVKFEFTGKLADPYYIPSGDAPGQPIASEMGCQLRMVPDVAFSNCSFLNTASGNLFQSWRNKPTGIFAVDSKISFGGGAAAVNFDNLYNGISSNGAAGGLTATLYASGKFNQVYQGVVVRGDIAPTVTGSVFNQIPDKVDSDDGDPAGVFSKGTQGIGLTNNEFYSNPAYDDSYGALINNSLGTGGAEMQFNTFGSFDIASRFEADNTSLITHCNTYNNDVQKSWNVSGSFANQINPVDATYFPDNKFFSVCDNVALTDIKSDPSFSYYERVNLLPQGPDNTTLKCYDAHVTLISATGQPGSTAQCVIEDPCPDPPRCATLATKYDGSSKDLRYRNQLLYAYNGWDWSAAPDSNYLPATQKGITLLTARNQQADKRILAATQTALGNYASAQSWSQLVSGTDAESVDFIQLYNMLIAAGQNGRDVYHLNAQDFAAVSGQLTHTTAASEQVRVIDHILNKRYHPLHAETASDGRAGQQQPAEEAKTAPGSFKVYPNPFSNIVQFVAHDGTNLIALRIYDISGTPMYDWKDAKGVLTLSWENKHNLEGVYFYQAYLSSGKVMQGKLIQMKQ